MTNLMQAKIVLILPQYFRIYEATIGFQRRSRWCWQDSQPEKNAFIYEVDKAKTTNLGTSLQAEVFQIRNTKRPSSDTFSPHARKFWCWVFLLTPLSVFYQQVISQLYSILS